MPHSALRISFLLLLLVFSSASSPSVADAASESELTVESHPSRIALPVGGGAPVEGSPGARPGPAPSCSRVHIRGRSRLRYSFMFAHALKLRVNVTQGDGLFRLPTIELCIHRNASISVGMCPEPKWVKLTKDPLVETVSPFYDWIVDFRMPRDPSRTVEVSTSEEFLFHRVVFLVAGISLMLTASTLSQSVLFYYGSAMTIGIMLVVLIILFQGMKLLPTGRKSSLAIFMYSSAVGLTTYFLHYLSGLLRSFLVEIGIAEDMHNPLAIFFVVCILIAGAWFGYWGVRKLVITEEGDVDAGVANFVQWAILILSAVMILQSSLDYLFAIAALIFSIILTAISRTEEKSRLVRHFLRGIADTFSSMAVNGGSDYNVRHPDYQTPRSRFNQINGIAKPGYSRLARSPSELFWGDSYFSSFHTGAKRRKFSKEEYDAFTREQTTRAISDLVSSPDFSKWARDNVERIAVTPIGMSNSSSSKKSKESFFQWY